MSYEYVCQECGRHIVDVVAQSPRYVCWTCASVPGWFAPGRAQGELTPEALLGFVLHCPPFGRIPVSELATLDELRIAYAENRETGMWALIHLRAIETSTHHQGGARDDHAV